MYFIYTILRIQRDFLPSLARSHSPDIKEKNQQHGREGIFLWYSDFITHKYLNPNLMEYKKISYCLP